MGGGVVSEWRPALRLWGIPVFIDPEVPPGEIRLKDNWGYLSVWQVELRHFDDNLRVCLHSQEEFDRFARAGKARW